jgi:cellulose synthase/poly-beta-1,6-N-acetylglucosamine synthase-like glycosyltransferase
MTTFLVLWLATQAIAVLLVWLFALRTGRKAVLESAPPVVVIVPVKGNHEEFGPFLDHLFAQDYPAYRVVFAVESEEDSAIAPIKARQAQWPDRVRFVVAGLSQDEGQKCANLRAALDEVGVGDEIVVFADSDIRPDRDWLTRLVEPLTRDEADIVSGFAWLVPKDRSPWSLILVSMAATMVTVPRLPLLNACWGGSTAMRRERCETLNLREAWRGASVDDLQMTAVAQRAGMTIVAPHEVLPRLYFTTSGFADVAADALRWLLFFRVYVPATFALTLIGLSFAAAGWLAAAVAALIGQPWPLAAALVLALVRTAGRAMIINRLWGRAGLAENRAYLVADPITTPIAAVVNAGFVWCALFLRRTAWGGITYEVLGPQQTKVISRRGPA